MVDSEAVGTTSARTKILAYLGQLKKDDFIPAKKLCYDLGLRYTTAKNTLTMLEERGLVEKKIENVKGTVASFRIDPDATEKRNGVAMEQIRIVPYTPPEWSEAYGHHPYSV